MASFSKIARYPRLHRKLVQYGMDGLCIGNAIFVSRHCNFICQDRTCGCARTSYFMADNAVKKWAKLGLDRETWNLDMWCSKFDKNDEYRPNRLTPTRICTDGCKYVEKVITIVENYVVTFIIKYGTVHNLR